MENGSLDADACRFSIFIQNLEKRRRRDEDVDSDDDDVPIYYRSKECVYVVA